MSETFLIHLQPVLGMAVILFIAWALSEDRGAFRIRLVALISGTLASGLSACMIGLLT
jgi:nucleoside permease NupC